jgi:predicted TIM-barrel fold metal-dependent hydrolase
VWTNVHGVRRGALPFSAGKCGKLRAGEDETQFMAPEFVDSTLRIEVIRGYQEILNIDKAVLLQNPCYGEQFEYVNRIRDEYPGVYASTGTADPNDRDAYIATARLCIEEYKYKGMKFELPDIPVDLILPSNAYIYETLIDLNGYFVIDMGWGDGSNDYRIDDMIEIAKRYPELKIIMPHLGISRLWDPVQRGGFDALKKTLSILEHSENVWFDIAALPLLVGAFEEYPYPTQGDALKVVKESGAIGRVMWGTDFPSGSHLCTYRDRLLSFVHHSGFLTDDEREDILGRTALNVWFDC